MDYQDLKAEVEFWLRRESGDTLAVRFIALAEDDIDDAIRAEGMEEVITIPGADSHIVTLPSTLAQDRLVQVGDNPPLDKESMSFVFNRRSATTTPDKAAYYARDGRSLYLDLAVATGTDITVVQTKYLEKLSASVQTNWLLDSNYNLYLAGSLYWGYLFHKDAKSADVWQGKYEKALASFISENKSDKWAGQLTVKGR